MKISLIHKIKKSGVLQQDSSDCGAACIATLLRFYGIHVNFENTREHCGTQGNGGNLLGLYQAAQHFGFKSGGAQGTVSDLKEIKQSKHITLYYAKRITTFCNFLYVS